MKVALRLPLLAAVALTGLGLTVPAQAQQASISFFVTSVGKGNGADLGGLAGADAHCQALASAAGSTNTNWRAYLSTTARGARWRQRARTHRQGSMAKCERRGRGEERGRPPLQFEQITKQTALAGRARPSAAAVTRSHARILTVRTLRDSSPQGVRHHLRELDEER